MIDGFVAREPVPAEQIEYIKFPEDDEYTKYGDDDVSFSVEYELMAWCSENMRDKYRAIIVDKTLFMYFADVRDAIHYKLYWS